MKVVLAFLCVCVAATSAARLRRAEGKYTSKYDNIDLDNILKSDRLLNNYFKCLMGTGSCTPDGAELKTYIPDALENKCAQCSETQKKGADKVIRFLIEKKADKYTELEKKYDPSGIYRKQYEAEAKERGYNLPPKA